MSVRPKRVRPFVSRPRCIYTGKLLDSADEKLKPSHEHIVPLALGGSNQFTTDDVSECANHRAGNEIDDEVANSLPFLMLRHRYKLSGHRKKVPNLKLRGEFIDINAPARLEVTDSGDLVFEFEDEQKTSGQIVTLASTEERIRFLLRGRLAQANKRRLSLITEFGEIKDEEDIEIALMLADRHEGREFKAKVTIDTTGFHAARAHLLVKIALGLGHRVLGPEWTFGPGGMMLRSHLFPGKKDLNFGRLKGTINADLPDVIPQLFGITEDRHVMAILPMKRTVALIALFGGQIGTAVIDLGIDSRRLLNSALRNKEPLDCAFSIPLNVKGSRPLQTRSIQEIANVGDLNNLLPESRAAAEMQLRDR